MINTFLKIITLVMILLALFCAEKSMARNVGVMGETYPIIEMDFLEFIQARLATIQKNGQWKTMQEKMQQDAVRYRDRPTPVYAVTRAVETKSWLWNPTMILDHDITTPDGKLIAKQGTVVNPLKVVSLSKALIFYDGDDKEQTVWVKDQDKKLNGRVKIILVKGAVLDAEKRLQKPIYFDQEGRLTTRFGISHVPAIAVQTGLYLKITEVAL
jgi:conjugal transfer pilus assembly protein TraW